MSITANVMQYTQSVLCTITTHLLYTIKLPTYVQVTANETKTFTPCGQETDLGYYRDYR